MTRVVAAAVAVALGLAGAGCGGGDGVEAPPTAELTPPDAVAYGAALDRTLTRAVLGLR